MNAALSRAAAKAGAPLGLAALATAVGFSSFLPTAYRGLSELGQIAGAGMIIAFIGSITLLPALLKVLNPPGEPHPVGFAALAAVDRFLERHRIPIVAVTLLTVALASPLLYFLQFDFNPLHLSSPKVESVATYLELRSDPRTGADSINIVVPDLAAADSMAHRLTALPQVAETMTLSNFVPADQDEKLKRIADAATAIDASLNPTEIEATPTDQDTIDALSSTAESLSSAAGNMQGTGADAAQRLSGLLSRLAQSDPATRGQMEATIVEPLIYSLDHLRQALKPQRISIDLLPPDLADDWITKDGRARIQVLPRGNDPDDTQTLRNFATVCDRDLTDDSPAPDQRRAAHAGAPHRRGAGDAGIVRRARPSAQLRERAGTAALARRRSRVQDLLHHGVEIRQNRLAAIEPDAGGRVQRDDDRDGIRQPVVLEPPRDLQHGEADGARSRHDHDGSRTVSTRPDGSAAQTCRVTDQTRLVQRPPAPGR
jgi:hypothetical protein